MKNQSNLAKLGLLAGAVGLIATGCASSGVARYDTGSDADLSASARTGVSSYDTGSDSNYIGVDGESVRPLAVSTLSFSPITAPKRVGAWPHELNVRVIEDYTFVVPAGDVDVSADLPRFNEDLPSGAVFTEAAGGEAGAYRVVRHTPNSR